MKNYKIYATCSLRNSKVCRYCDTYQEACVAAKEIQNDFYRKAKEYGLDLYRYFSPVTIREVATGREWELCRVPDSPVKA